MVVLRSRRLLDECSIFTRSSPGCAFGIVEEVPGVTRATMIILYARYEVDELAVGTRTFVRMASSTRLLGASGCVVTSVTR